jgi:hypothetical protein
MEKLAKLLLQSAQLQMKPSHEYRQNAKRYIFWFFTSSKPLNNLKAFSLLLVTTLFLVVLSGIWLGKQVQLFSYHYLYSCWPACLYQLCG